MRLRDAPNPHTVVGVQSFRRSIEPVLGTRLTLRVDAAVDVTAEAAFEAVLAEAERLEAALSAYRPESAFADTSRSASGAPIKPTKTRSHS